MVLLPASYQKYLKEGLEALPRNLIADRAKKESLILRNNIVMVYVPPKLETRQFCLANLW